jgi:PAS domain S-box-containing protein
MYRLKFDRWKALTSAVGEPLAISLIIAVLVVNGALAYTNINLLDDRHGLVVGSGQIMLALERFASSLKDAEVGQRGYLLTGKESYLEPYERAVRELPNALAQIRTAADHLIELQQLVPELEVLTYSKLAELRQSIATRNNAGLDAALLPLQTNAAQLSTDRLHTQIEIMKKIARGNQSQRRDTTELAKLLAIVATLATTGVSLFLVGGILYVINHNRRRREKVAALMLEQQNRLHVTDRQLRLFVEQVSDYAIFMISPDLRATTWNQGVEQVLGFTEEEFIGLEIIPAIFPPSAREDGSAAEEFFLAAELGQASDDRWMCTKNGTHFWASGITTGVRDSDGRLLGFNKVLRNLTERKLAEDELKTLAAELAERDRNKTTFLATLAHELRNPLAPIKNTVQLLSLSNLDSETQELIDIVQRQTDQMVRLIDDLMDISRISRGRIELKKERVSLASLVDTAVEACLPLIHSNGQVLKVYPPESEIVVDADPARMTQVISNLLTNASKYSDVGGTIEISYGVRNEHVIVEVLDNGMGIVADELEDVFKMFSQGAETIERGSSGLGIGLTLVRSLVELHGGTVAAFSEGLGKGARFTILLPPPVEEAPEGNVQTETEMASPLQPLNVLVVDDSRSITLVMSRLLSKFGHAVRTAENGLEAIQMLHAMDGFQPDIIFSDISMPGMNGYEFVRHLRADPQCGQVYAVAMTGFGQQADRNKALEAGFNEHTVKPVDVRVLRKIFSGLTKSGA